MAVYDNRPDPYACQIQSPFFRIPRELRDEIYEYYVLERHGYHHHLSTGKLSLANSAPIDLRLTHICRAIAQEMKDVPLRTNTVTFKTDDIRDDQGFHGFQSRAGRLEKVIEGVVRTRRRMLHYVAECITPEMLESTISRFGDGARRLVERFRVVEDWPRTPSYGNGSDLTDTWHGGSKFDESPEYHEALLYLLKLASADERFKTLAEGAFDVVPHEYLAWDLITKRATLYYALNWQPLPWEIPTEEELVALEVAFYTIKEGAVGNERGGGNLPNTFKYLARFKWFFSGAAIAISYLQQHPHQRSVMRRVILQERRMSVSNPEAHMLGFSDICCENPSIRVVRHVRLWSSTKPFGWFGVFAAGSHNAQTALSDAPIYALINWIHAEMNSRSHLPGKPFTLVIEEFAPYAWEVVKQAVLLQAVMTASYQRLHLDAPQRLHRFDFLRHPWALPCHYPNTFAVAMKKFLEHKWNFITFDGVEEAIWDYNHILQAHSSWSPEICYAEWKALVTKWVKLPKGGERALAKPQGTGCVMHRRHPVGESDTCGLQYPGMKKEDKMGYLTSSLRQWNSL
jgi:hypothetical protein